MNDSGLSEAFNDCIDRLNAGQSLETCLDVYPQYAAELRSLLLAGTAVRQLRPSDMEVMAARERVRARLGADSPTMAVPARRWQWSRLAMVAGLLLVLAVVLRGGVQTWQVLRQPTPTLVETILLTPTPTLTTPTVTASVSPSALPSDTSTPTASATATLTLTREPSPTMRVTNTLTPKPPSATLDDETALSSCTSVQPDGWVSYQVQAGDTLSTLATLTGITVEELDMVNCLDAETLIVVGEELFLPVMPPQGDETPQPSPTGSPLPTDSDDDSGDDDGTVTDESDTTDDGSSDDSSDDDGSDDDGTGAGSGTGAQNGQQNMGDQSGSDDDSSTNGRQGAGSSETSEDDEHDEHNEHGESDESEDETEIDD